jgi:hypothetical protein
VTFALTGPAARGVHVLVDGRAQVVDTLDGPATVTLEMPAGVFTRLGGGRVDPRAVVPQIVVTGDTELGERVLANLAYTI